MWHQVDGSPLFGARLTSSFFTHLLSDCTVAELSSVNTICCFSLAVCHGATPDAKAQNRSKMRTNHQLFMRTVDTFFSASRSLLESKRRQQVAGRVSRGENLCPVPYWSVRTGASAGPLFLHVARCRLVAENWRGTARERISRFPAQRENARIYHLNGKTFPVQRENPSVFHFYGKIACRKSLSTGGARPVSPAATAMPPPQSAVERHCRERRPARKRRGPRTLGCFLVPAVPFRGVRC